MLPDLCAQSQRDIKEPPRIGRKDDGDKLRYDLMPELAEEEVVAVLTYGAHKYGAHNWRHVEDALERYFAAARRHMKAARKGERIDPESGRNHLAHAIASLLFLLEFDMEKEQ